MRVAGDIVLSRGAAGRESQQQESQSSKQQNAFVRSQTESCFQFVVSFLSAVTMRFFMYFPKVG